jgi:acetyl-CoA carboxylase carboxyl transferase subunit alpha
MGLTAGEIVKLARHQERLTSLDYFEKIFTDFQEFHGDRLFGDDPAIVGGIANLAGKPVTVIGIQKGNDLKENMARNFGQPNPEGYRKALRLMKQAEKFKRPVICFVNTPGAFCGVEAEERGEGEAIARNLMEMSDLKVPIISIVTGEGGSGGALALALADEVWMMEYSIYAILSPEGFASLDVIDRVIPETLKGKKLSEDKIIRMMKKLLIEKITELSKISTKELIENRYQRFRKF